MTCDRFHLVGIVGTLLAALLCPPVVAQTSDPHKLIAEADRLAWLRVWTRAEPLYAKAREAFIAQRRRAERPLRGSEPAARSASDARRS